MAEEQFDISKYPKIQDLNAAFSAMQKANQIRVDGLMKEAIDLMMAAQAKTQEANDLAQATDKLGQILTENVARLLFLETTSDQ